MGRLTRQENTGADTNKIKRSVCSKAKLHAMKILIMK
jgi:hypothetical protein